MLRVYGCVSAMAEITASAFTADTLNSLLKDECYHAGDITGASFHAQDVTHQKDGPVRIPNLLIKRYAT